MFKRVLVANRGEIALRIIRALKELGVESVAVYSEADEDALYRRFADETICIGPPPSAKSYLDIKRIISAAEVANVDAIHPGYGFLSENSQFAEVCRDCKITFIGPSPETIAAVGDKSRAKEIARSAKVPVIDGSEGVVRSVEDAVEIAERVGYPVMIKASAGGGGRGMRIAHSQPVLQREFNAASTEAMAAFGNGDLYVEKFVAHPRHVEIQFIADAKGNVVHLGERDCTTQRRHQKLIEEAPCPVLKPKVRKAMGEAAVRIAKASKYVNAGTVEFLLDPEGRFYFMELNSRLQVEHPVTELVTGIDLVKEQIRIAAGEELSFSQRDIEVSGHAIECRINAEDPSQGFRPSPGRVGQYVPPGGPGVRVDSHLFSGYTIPPHYDSMVAKLIVHRPTREEAIETMLRALGEYRIEGIATTIPLYQRVLRHASFRSGQFDTGFIDQFLAR
ncbi:MAG: acetyl-CoA carboxylase biotin carboxylase subunit [Planctomycetota bacterium]